MIVDPKTKLRSALIGLIFIAYSLGCIGFVGATYITKEAYYILMICLAMCLVVTLPNFFWFRETIHYTHHQGHLQQLNDTLRHVEAVNKPKPDSLISNQRLFEIPPSMSSDSFHKEFYLKAVLKEKKLETPGFFKQISILLSEREHRYKVIAFCCIGGMSYSLFFGESVSIDNLGKKDFRLNGILFGVCQGIGALGVLPFLHLMPRRKWSVILQLMLLLGALALVYLSVVEQTDSVQLMQSIVSTVWITSISNASQTLFFVFTSESFPTHLRGTSMAFILLISKLLGATSPLLSVLAESLSMHILVGCSVYLLLSIPMTLTLKETYDPKRKTLAAH